MRRLTGTLAILVLATSCGRGTAVEEKSLMQVEPAAPRVEEAVIAPAEPLQALALETETHCREVGGLLHAQRFVLNQPHAYSWMKDHPAITEGTLVVLEVDPECARPRQMAMPVLYAGSVPIEIAVDGYPSGRLVAFIPGHVDLTATPLYYGAADLPERVDASCGAAQLAAALKDGIEPFPEKVVAEAMEKGGSDLHLAGTTELYAAAGELASP